MAILTPPPAAPQRGDRTTFANRVDAFITWLINFVTELVSLVANLNSIAVGGAYAIPYGYSAAIGSGGPGKLVMNTSTASAATALVVDTRNASGTLVAAALSAMGAGSSSFVKGQIRLSTFDSSKWAIFNITSYTQDSLGFFGTFLVQYVASSSASPFAEGDSVVLSFQRTGDKGDKGDNGTSLTPVLWVRDEKPSGTTGGSPLVGANVRPLNSVFRNTIPGASLSGNRVTLPAGTYRFHGNAPAYGVSAHQAYLYSITAGNALVYGSSEYTNGSTTTRSLFVGAEVVFSTSTTLELRQWCATNSGTLGMPSSSGVNEVYSELFFEKIA